MRPESRAKAVLLEQRGVDHLTFTSELAVFTVLAEPGGQVLRAFDPSTGRAVDLARTPSRFSAVQAVDVSSARQGALYADGGRLYYVDLRGGVSAPSSWSTGSIKRRSTPSRTTRRGSTGLRRTEARRWRR
jgi:hypothetical protein